MENIVIDGNEYPIQSFSDSDEDAGLKNGVALTIGEDGDGAQRASVWEIPGTNKHVISLERGSTSPHSRFEANYEIQVTGSDSVALREFVKSFEEIAELDGQDYILTSDDADLVGILSQVINRIESIDDGRPREVLAEMIEGIATLGNDIEDLDLSEEVLDTEALQAESMIQQAKIANGVSKLESKIEDSSLEDDFQDLFERHPWFFGNQYVEQINRELLHDSQVDFALKSINNYLDIFEIKTPDAQVLRADDNHDNWVPRAGLTDAIIQLQNYIHESEEIQHIIENEQGIQVLKPRGTIVIGSDLEPEKRDALRLIESHLNRVDLVTFTDLLERGERMVEFYQRGGDLSVVDR